MKRTLSVLALGGLLVAGCGAGTTDVERESAAPSPMISTPVVSPDDVESPTIPEPTETGSVEVSPEPSNTVTMSPEEVPNQPESGDTPDQSTSTSANTPVDSGGSWTSMEVTVQTAADATKLTGTPSDFQTFVAGQAGTPDANGCVNEFTILAFHPDGYAAGQEFAPGCGGSQNIWGKRGGQWEVLLMMQSVVECTDMANNDIPRGLPDIPCLDGAGNVVDW